MLRSNQLTLHVFIDEKYIPIQAEMEQSQISNNKNVLFNLPPTSIQMQSNNGEKQKAMKP